MIFGRQNLISVTRGLALVGAVFAGSVAAPATAQIYLGGPTRTDVANASICRGQSGELLILVDDDACNDGFDSIESGGLYFGPLNAPQTVIDTDGTAVFAKQTTFDGPATFNGTTTFNGSTTYNGAISANGVSSTGGLTNTGGFTNNGSANITGVLSAGSLNTGTGLITGGSANLSGTATVGSLISNGQISGTSLFTTGSATVQGFFTAQNGASLLGTTQLATVRVFQGLSVENGATVNMNGNRVQNVGTPTAGTDAANKNYVDANVAAVQNGVVTLGGRVDQQAAQIATIQATDIRQDGQIAAIQATDTRQDGQITAIQATDTRQDGQITAIQATDTRQDGQITAIQAVDTQQAAQITGVQTVNTRQDTELTDVRTVNTQQSQQIAATQAIDTQQSQQILALQQGQSQLFDLSRVNSRRIGRANEGVAMALAMESPALPAGTSFALSGGIGYFEDQAAATTAVTARVADHASVSAGIGVGFKSGTVGARSGFQVAW